MFWGKKSEKELSGPRQIPGLVQHHLITQWKMAGKKGTKKTDLRYECTVCKKQSVQKKGIRVKRLEFK